MSAHDDEVKKKLHTLWLKYLPTIRARLDSIQAAVKASERGVLSRRMRENATHDAHKLAGSLGTFGVLNGSALATELEKLLSDGNAQAARLTALFKLLKQEIDSR